MLPLALTVLAAAAVLLAHRLNRGRARPMPLGTVRFVPARASRRRRFRRLRDPLLLAARLALLALALAWWAALGEAPVAREVGAAPRAVSMLAAAGGVPREDAALLPSPVFAGLALYGVPGRLVLAATAREGTLVAPPAWPVHAVLAPPPPATPLRVSLRAGPERATDARHVAAALRSLPPERNLRLVQECTGRGCTPPDAAYDLAFVLGAGRPPEAAVPVVTAGEAETAGAPAGPTALRWVGAGRALWSRRFDPARDPAVRSRAFPELLARQLERVGRTPAASIAPPREPERRPPGWLAPLLVALFLAERFLAGGRRGIRLG